MISPLRASSAAVPPLRGWARTMTSPAAFFAAPRVCSRASEPMAATSELRVNSAALRSATVLPSFITTMRSAVDRISPRRCEMRMMAVPRAVSFFT